MRQPFKHIDAAERDFIHRHLNEGRSRRWIAAELGRPASAVSREVGRNRGEARGYDGIDAGKSALGRRRRGPVKLREGSALREHVFTHLRKGWSPQQISGTLARMPQAIGQVSHETIYQTIYVLPRGETRRQLIALLRQGRKLRRPRGQGADLSPKSRRDLEKIAYSLNTRPRACLGFQTPEEVFYNEIQRPGVALQI